MTVPLLCSRKSNDERFDPCSKRAFSLVEVAVGLFVFVMIFVGGGLAVTQAQKLAHSNIVHNTARVTIESYMERLKSISYSEYKEVLADPDNIPFLIKGIDSL